MRTLTLSAAALMSVLFLFGTSASAALYPEDFDDETNGDATPGSFTTASSLDQVGGRIIPGFISGTGQVSLPDPEVESDGAGKDYEFYSEAQVTSNGQFARYSSAALVNLPPLATSHFLISTDFEVDANELGSGATNPGHGSHAGIFARNTSGAVPTNTNAYSLRLDRKSVV